MAVRQGGKSASFAEAAGDLRELAQVRVSGRHLERVVERVGGEWAANRDAEVAAFREGRLGRDYRQEPGPGVVAAVMLDGGRVQTRAEGRPPGVHGPGWKETKVACCLTLDSAPSERDPQPDPPAKFLDPPAVEELVRQMKARTARGAGGGEAKGEGRDRRRKKKAKKAKKAKRKARKLVRTAVATMGDSEAFGWQVAAEVHRRGLDRAARKACVCDGAHGNWSIHEMHLLPSGFVAILDFLHLLVYLYAAAQAFGGKGAGKGAAGAPRAWSLYERWLRLAWAGQATQLLGELAEAAGKLGPPPEDADEKDPRRVLADAVTYVTNNQGRMDYPTYRKLGLPISSAPVESLIKQLNRRVKGSEKFWLKGGAEAVLQVRAAYLSDDGRAERYWERPRPRRRAAGHGPLPQRQSA